MWFKFLKLLANVRWEWFIKLYKKPSYMTFPQELEVKRYLRENYYIIATYDPYSLSGIFVLFAHWILTGKKAKYTHVLYNVESDGDLDENNVLKFRFAEATSKGVHFSDFQTALGHSKRIALIRPKYYSQETFNNSVSEVYQLIGREYDFGYDMKDEQKMSCIEMVWFRLNKLPFAEDHLRCFKMLMDWEGNVTPEMVFCPDFQVIKKWEF